MQTPSRPKPGPDFAPSTVFRDRLRGLGEGGAERLEDAPALIYLPGGTFLMGDARGGKDEQPVHPVKVAAFALGRTAVTWGEYLRFCEATDTHWPHWLEPGSEYHVEHGSNDYYRQRGVSRAALDLPVVGVSWEDARAYCDWLSAGTGQRYALPTEAQWEYACRAGTSTRWSCGDDEGQLSTVAWFSDNAGGRLHPVGQKQANPWGLYDMHGNCWEWCADWYAADYYQQRADRLAKSASALQRGAIEGQQSPSAWQRFARALGIGASGAAVRASGVQPLASKEPSGPVSGSFRVCRGGAWHNTADYCRSAYRDLRHPSYRNDPLGFRLSRTV